MDALVMVTQTGKWFIWLIAAAVSAVGLRNYRVDNELDAWLPNARPVSTFRSYCVVGGEAESFDSAEIAQRLRALPEVAFCIERETIDTLGRLAGVSPEDFVVSADGTYEGVFCFSVPTTTDSELTAAVQRSLLEQLGDGIEQVAFGGPAVFHVALNEFSQRRLPLITGLIIAFGSGLLWWVTGRLLTATQGVAALMLSQITWIGAMSWLRLPMDMATSMVPPLVFALGFSYTAHRALRRGNLRTLALCAGTTALGIGWFAITGLPPIRSFALFGVLGLLLAWLAVVMLVTPLPSEHRPAKRWLRPLLVCSATVVLRRPRIVIASAAILTVAGVAAILWLPLESNPLDYFPPDARVVRDSRRLNERLTGMLPSQLVVSGCADPRHMLTRTPGVRKVINVSLFVPGEDQVFWCLADNDALGSLSRHMTHWQTWADATGVEIHWTGVAAQLTAASSLVRRAAMLSLPAMALAAMVVVGWITRSWCLAMVSVWANLLPVGALLLVSTLARWPLEIPSLMTGAIAIGLAIDDTVHMANGIRCGWSPRRMLVTYWRPCVGSTIVTAGCMLLFALAPFRPTAQFGVFISIAAFTALLADVLLLPAVWQRMRSDQF